MSLICDAIRQRRLIEFDYDGKHRVVQPYCHGTSTRGIELLRAIQIGGQTGSGGLGFGKLWHVAKISKLRVTDEEFLPSDPNYNPNDSAMLSVHCCV